MIAARGVQDVVRPAILGVMVGCVALSVVTLAELFSSGWDGTYLVWFCALTAVEAYFSQRLYRPDLSLPYGWMRFRVLEVALLFVVLVVGVDIAAGNAPLQDGVPQIDPRTIWLFIPVYCSWLAASATSRDLARLDDPSAEEPWGAPPAQRLGARFFMGGLLLFVVAGVTQQNVAEALRMPSVSSSGPVLNVLVYFLLGALMLGQVRYAALRRRWHRQEITVVPGLGSRWVRYCLLFVALVAILALVLPTSYTLSLLDLGRAARDGFSAVLTQLVTLIGPPLARLLSLLGISPHPTRPRTTLPNLPRHLPRIRPLPPHRANGHAISGNWGALLRSLLFWSVVLASAVYLLRSYLQRHPRGARVVGRLSALLGVLSRLWAMLRLGLRRYAGRVAARIPLGLALKLQRPMAPDRLLRFSRPGAQSPRGQVLFYYLSIIRHADRRGFPRRRSQTPHEFGGDLAPRLREAEGDMNFLTDAFVEARYSRHGVEESQASRARASWQRVRAALRRAGKEDQ